MSKTLILLIRHGQTDWNAESRFQGSIDRPLNEQGVVQSVALGEKLSSWLIHSIYTSPLIRAYKTASILAEFCKCSVQIRPELRERSFGSIEGMTLKEFRAQYREQVAIFNRLHKQERWHYKYCPLSESYFDTAHRVLPILKQITELHSAQTTAVVTHGSVIRSLIMILSEEDEREIYIENTGCVCLEAEGSHLRLVLEAGPGFGFNRIKEKRGDL